MIEASSKKIEQARTVIEKVEVITLTIPVDFAKRLIEIANRTGGDPKTSSRKYMDDLVRALHAASPSLKGWREGHDSDGPHLHGTSSLWFMDTLK